MEQLPGLFLCISGFESCSFFQKAVTVSNALPVLHPDLFNVQVDSYSTKEDFKSHLPHMVSVIGPEAASHTTSPLVWISSESLPSKKYIGGCSDLLVWAKELPNSLEAARAHMMKDNPNLALNFDYDTTVLGGGMTGLAAAVELAKQGGKVALIETLDFEAFIFQEKCALFLREAGEMLQKAARYGVLQNDPEKDTVYSHALEQAGDCTKRVIFRNRALLREKKVDLYKGAASFESSQEILCTDSGTQKKIRSRSTLICSIPCGANIPDFQGKDHVLLRDQFLSRKERPRAVCLIGSGQTALELAYLMKPFSNVVLVSDKPLSGIPGLDDEALDMILRVLTETDSGLAACETDTQMQLIQEARVVEVAMDDEELFMVHYILKSGAQLTLKGLDAAVSCEVSGQQSPQTMMPSASQPMQENEQPSLPSQVEASSNTQQQQLQEGAQTQQHQQEGQMSFPHSSRYQEFEVLNMGATKVEMTSGSKGESPRVASRMGRTSDPSIYLVGQAARPNLSLATEPDYAEDALRIARIILDDFPDRTLSKQKRFEEATDVLPMRAWGKFLPFAAAGLFEKEALERYTKEEVEVIWLDISSYSALKVLVLKQGKRVVGVQVYGPQADDSIQGLRLLQEFKNTSLLLNFCNKLSKSPQLSS